MSVKDAALQFLDEENLYKMLKQQREESQKKKGRKLTSNKEFSGFMVHRWERMRAVYDHQGNLIGKSGYKVDEYQEQRERKERMDKKQTRRRKMTKQSMMGAQSSDMWQYDSDKSDKDQEEEKKEEVFEAQFESFIQDGETVEGSPTEKNLTARQIIEKVERKMRLNSDKELQELMRLKELDDLISEDDQDYWQEWKMMKKEEMLNYFRSFITNKQTEFQEVAQEINDMESKVGKDNEIFYNFQKKLNAGEAAKQLK